MESPGILVMFRICSDLKNCHSCKLLNTSIHSCPVCLRLAVISAGVHGKADPEVMLLRSHNDGEILRICLCQRLEQSLEQCMCKRQYKMNAQRCFSLQDVWLAIKVI